MRKLALLLFTVLFAASLPVHAEPAASAPFRVAVIDTGIDASHPEFRPGQVVAWKDFTPEASPTPMDGHGHGTATASLVAGLNQASCGTGIANAKLSYAPGADLVIARVGDSRGSISGSVSAAVAWAVSEGARVISISIGSIAPIPSFESTAFRNARAAGVLIVVSAGNGAGNLGLAPYPSWMSTYGNDPKALVVGGGGPTGGVSPLTSTTGNSDPEVVAWSDSVCVARANTPNLTRMSGTSFSAPLVAGLAANAMMAALSTGAPSDPDTIETVVQRSATNNVLVPYLREGLGYLGRAEATRAATHAAAGTMPDYEAQGPHATADLAYHDSVVRTGREPLWPYRMLLP